MSLHTVDLIRHAHSAMNGLQADPTVVPFIGGRQNYVELDELGVQQARDLGYFALVHHEVPTLVFCSPATRTLQTHEISAKVMGLVRPPIIDDRLQELHQGEWTNRARSIYQDPAVKAEMDRLQSDFAAPGGESMNDVADHMENVLEPLALILEAMREPQKVWIHTHGVAIKSYVGRKLGWSHEQTYRTAIGNASRTRLVLEGGDFRPLFISQSTTAPWR